LAVDQGGDCRIGDVTGGRDRSHARSSIHLIEQRSDELDEAAGDGTPKSRTPHSSSGCS
jgi:hypothetical protein